MENTVFNKENVFFTEDSFVNNEALFRYIAQKAIALDYVHSEEACFQGLMERESQSTTAFQDGFAIPHCKSDTVKAPQLMFIKTKAIAWESLDGSDIENSFAILIPSTGAKEHLRYLAQIARALIDDNFREALKNSSTTDEAYTIISEKLGV